MLTQNFRTSAQSALISAVVAVSIFALVIGPDGVRFAALAVMLVLGPAIALTIRIAAIVEPEVDPATLKSLDIAPAPRIDQALIAAAWLGAAGAFLTGWAAAARFAPTDSANLQAAALAGAVIMALGAAPVLAGLARSRPPVTLTTLGVRLSPERLIRWRDIEKARIASLGFNRLTLVLKPSPRDPNGPPQRICAGLPAVIEPWLRQASAEMIARRLEP